MLEMPEQAPKDSLLQGTEQMQPYSDINTISSGLHFNTSSSIWSSA